MARHLETPASLREASSGGAAIQAQDLTLSVRVHQRTESSTRLGEDSAC